MTASTAAMDLYHACELLGVGPGASDADLRRAFHDAAKRLHPDRPGGDAEAFRDTVVAYERLREPIGADRLFHTPAAMTAPVETLDIPIAAALRGAEIERALDDGVTLKIRLPAGLRSGDKVRAGRRTFEVAVRGDERVLNEGDDIWMTVTVDPVMLARGGRLAVDTPGGKRKVWITREAAAQGIVRLAGEGLPARGKHRQGHLYLRLAPGASTVESLAKALRRRFARAWAA